MPEQLGVEYGEVLEWLKALPSGLPLERPATATFAETFGVARPRAVPEISGELFRRVRGFGGG